jgi:hypothetical protein
VGEEQDVIPLVGCVSLDKYLWKYGERFGYGLVIVAFTEIPQADLVEGMQA